MVVMKENYTLMLALRLETWWMFALLNSIVRVCVSNMWSYFGGEETTEVDDWPLELGPHFTDVGKGRYMRLFARTVGVLLLAF